jgi:hypothetical protein
MLQIQNISDYLVSFAASYQGGQGRPLYVKLGPGEHTLITQAELANWPMGTKQNLASYVQRALLRVNEATCSHTAIDKGHLLPEFDVFNLETALDRAALVKSVINEHMLDPALHTAADTANLITVADPTDLATLITFFTSALTGATAQFNAHIGNAVHPVADISNTVAIVPTDLDSSILALRELEGRFGGHKRELPAGGTVLSPPAIIAYT